MENKDLEIRVRRLEQLHIWGASIVAILLVGYIINKRYKILKKN